MDIQYRLYTGLTDQQCLNLLDFIKNLKNKNSFLGGFNVYQLRNLLANGFTIIATYHERIVGVLNFDVLESGEEQICFQNILLVDSNVVEDVFSSLLSKEVEYLREHTHVLIIKALVDVREVNSNHRLKEFGFVPRSVSVKNYSGTNCRCIVFEKDITALKKTNSYNMSLLKLLLLSNLKYNSNCKSTFTTKMVKYLLSLKTLYKIQKSRKLGLEDIKQRKQVKVMFVASSMSMWKYQYLYDELRADSRFQLYVLLSPFPNFTKSHQYEEMQRLKCYFSKHQIECLDYMKDGSVFDVKKHINPDLIFYTQPYLDTLHPLHDAKNFLDKFIAYYPYGYYLETEEIFYNNRFQEFSWKLLYSNHYQLEHAQHFMLNHGKNVEVVGYPTADDFCLRKAASPWKPCGLKKRIIWAPHFSVNQNTSFTNHSNFMWMADLMLNLAEKYKDQIQIAFKPHPRLKSELYCNLKWGKEKTDAYYRKWDDLDNGQVETGDFIDLFLTSDAMIHDSASFCVDYMYTKKPVMYVACDIEVYKLGLDDLGQKVMDRHYIGKDSSDIQSFIENMVIQGKDPKLQERSQLVEQYLLPPNGKTTAQNTYDCLVKNLFGR